MNSCEIGLADDLTSAFKRAYEADPISIFGGIIAVNREIDVKTANQMSGIFLEVVMAPSFTEEALEILTEKQNIRLLQIRDKIGRASCRERVKITGVARR